MSSSRLRTRSVRTTAPRCIARVPRRVHPVSLPTLHDTARHSSGASRRIHPAPNTRFRLLRANRCAVGFQERSQLRRCFELRNRLQFLEGRSEGVRQAPHRARLKILVLRIEVEVVNDTCEMLRRLQIAFDEGAVDDELRGRRRELLLSPLLRLSAHGLEVALHAVDANRQTILQGEVLRVLGQHRRERARDNVTIIAVQ